MIQKDKNTPTVLSLEHVTKIYTQWRRSGKFKNLLKDLIVPDKEEIRALDDLSLDVNKGEFVAYAGANGAGKSTTIKILSGILQPTKGNVRVLGLDPAKNRVALMRRIGVLFGQRTELWWDHPVITSYEWKRSVWHIDDTVYKKNLAQVTELLELEPLLQTFSRELSLGQRMRADLGMLLLHSPEVLFLDEPTLGLDVLAKRHMIAFLKRLNQEMDATIIVTSHDMDDLEEMAQRIVLLSQGQVVYDGDFNELRAVRGAAAHIQIQRVGAAPSLAGLRYINSSGDMHRYALLGEGKLNKVLGEISTLSDIADIEIKKAEIEDVIANLYLELKAEKANCAAKIN